MLRQAENRVRVEGILSEINLKYGSYEKNGETVENINGNVKVRVNQVVNDVEQQLEIPVYTFAPKYTREGKLNPAYESLETVMKEFKSIAATGDVNAADKVRITNANIRMNEFIGGNGTLVSYPRVSTSFINRATGDFRPEASWSLEFAVASMDFVTDKDGIELDPKKLRIKIIVPQYGGRVDTMELYATHPNVIDAISTYWEANHTYTARGRLNFTTKPEEIIEESDFGEPETRVRTSHVSELIVTRGTQAPLDEEKEFPPAELKVALDQHKAYIEALKSQPARKAAMAPARSGKETIDLGF